MAWYDFFKLFWYAFTKKPPPGGICCGPFIPDLRPKLTDEQLKAAVAKVILKPGDPCDPDGVLNE